VQKDVQETKDANLAAYLNFHLTWLQNVQRVKLQNASLDAMLLSTLVFIMEKEIVQNNSNHVLLHAEKLQELLKKSKLKLKFHTGRLSKNVKKLSTWSRKSLTNTSNLLVNTERKELQKFSEEKFITTLKF
jgi:hypothetical protein